MFTGANSTTKDYWRSYVALHSRLQGWLCGPKGECVCVCLWNIWIDVKLLHSRGQERHGKSPANEDTYHRRWYQTWPVWRTCIVVITCCSGFASIQFLISGDGKRLHPRTSKSFLQFSALLLQSVKMGTIWLSLKGSVNFQLISSSSGLAMVALWYFLGSFHRPIPVRYNWNAFARKMHSISKFAMIVLSTSVCVCQPLSPRECNLSYLGAVQ